MIKNLKTKNTLNDNGSTLITVIVAIAFVTILVSIILGTTVINIRMKGIDKRTKDDFYYAEKALNDVYTGLGLEITKYAAEEYEKSFKKVGEVITEEKQKTDDDGNLVYDRDGNPVYETVEKNNYNQAQEAEKEFRLNFATRVDTFLSSLDAEKLDKYRTDSRGKVDKVGSSIYFQKKDGSSCTVSDKDLYRIILPGVQVSDTDTSQYRSVITTDIVINIPAVDFLGTSVDVSEYGLIANEGLYIEGRSTDTTKITGDVYAGIHATESAKDSDYKEINDEHSREKLFGGINIKETKAVFNGNYIVSKGDINLVGSNPKLRVYLDDGGNNLANLWFTSLRTLSEKTSIGTEPDYTNAESIDYTVDVNANTFALNDLALNANNSSARFKGNYYGYDDNTLETPLGILGSKTGRDDSKSSAIVINGNKVYLDMGGINNFVLMGKAYIDFTSDKDNTDVLGTKDQVVPTAEGVALKTNQQLYLVPTDFLEGPNPAIGGDPDSGGEVEFKLNSTLNNDWFGFKYLDSGSGETPDLEKIHKTYSVKQKDSDVWVYYDYINFNDDVWMPIRNESGKIIGYKDDPADSSVKLGTGGSISSKQKFFYDIMTATAASETEGETQPSAYRLKQRIDWSTVNTDYFDLRGCVVGGGSDAHFYSKNAVVDYKRVDNTTVQSTVRENTDGMFRYAKYPQNLFRRYKWLCTKLDGQESIPLDSDVDDISDNDEWTEYDKNAPICHFIRLSKVDEITSIAGSKVSEADGAGLKVGAYGTVIAIKPVGGTLNLGDSDIPKISGTTFKGVAIVDGDIIVPRDMTVRGLLMATGTITLMGNNNVYYDKGLVQSRIEKELNLVKNSEDATQDIAYKPYYLIRYLSKDNGTSPLYDVEPGTIIKRDRIEADYNDFMHYENWQKGENDATPTPTPTSTP